MNEESKIVIVPCSGIGKTYGTVSREAAYELTDEIRPNQTRLVPLSLLVLGDEDARRAVSDSPAITIDGCKLACATKMVEESGGEASYAFSVLDSCRRHRDLKPRGIAELNETGEQLVSALVGEIAEIVDNLQAVVEDEKNA